MTCPRCHGERDIAIVKDGNVSPTYPCPDCCPAERFRPVTAGSEMDEAYNRFPDLEDPDGNPVQRGNLRYAFAEGAKWQKSVSTLSPQVLGAEAAQGYADSLRQQARWVDESREATVPLHDRITLDDVDTDELRAAADFILAHCTLPRAERGTGS